MGSGQSIYWEISLRERELLWARQGRVHQHHVSLTCLAHYLGVFTYDTGCTHPNNKYESTLVPRLSFRIPPIVTLDDGEGAVRLGFVTRGCAVHKPLPAQILYSDLTTTELSTQLISVTPLCDKTRSQPSLVPKASAQHHRGSSR